MINDLLTNAAAIIEIITALYIVSAIAKWTLGKDAAPAALELVEAVLEEIDPLPTPRLPRIPSAPKPLYTPVTRVKTTRKPRAKKSEAIATEPKAKAPRKSRAKKQPE